MKVAIVGATGETGRSLVDGLLKSGSSFDITALIRPSSLDKPAVHHLRTLGVSVVPADLQGPQDDLVKILEGVNVVVSAIHFQSITDEIPLAKASKAAGVQRYVPCFFATVAPRGVMHLRDAKEDILDHIQQMYLPYTVIDVGWWYQILLPRVPSGRFDYALLAPINSIFAGGDNPIAVTDVRDIGLYVAKIISDPNTINKKVFAFTECLTQKQIFGLVEKMADEKLERTELSAAEIESNLSELKLKEGASLSPRQASYEYWYSWGIRGDNNPEHAKYLGYIIADDLYPGLKGRSLESFVGEVINQKAKRAYDK